MKRAREDFEAPDIITEPLASPFRRARGQIGAAPKRWKRYVVKKVQRLLTTYFESPAGLAAPAPWSREHGKDAVSEDEPVGVRTSLTVDQHQHLTLSLDVPDIGESTLTRYFSWSRRD
jgi:hypothetical protein